MKKTLSLTLASAMLLTMGTSAFADISFDSNSSNSAEWPNEFAFSGKLSVFHQDQVLTSALGSEDKVAIYPDSSLYLPLYHTVKGDTTVGDSTPTPKTDAPLTVGASAVTPEPSTGTIPYKGKIDKNWKINFIEKSKRLVESAEFYRAEAQDTQLLTDAVYVKVKLIDQLDSVEKEPLHFGIVISDKAGKNKTEQIFVKGDFANPSAGNHVDFDWANPVSGSAVWEVEKDQDGTATFEFGEDATYTVRMFSGEKVLLDLSRSYDKDLLAKYDTDMEFYNFKGSNDAFSATGTLSIPADKDDFIYEVAKGSLKPVDASYNAKDEVMEIKTKTLGSYVLSKEALDLSLNTLDTNTNTETDPTDDETQTEDGISFGDSTDIQENTLGSGNKPNPGTGAGNFVDAAVAMLALSLVGGVALIKKRK